MFHLWIGVLAGALFAYLIVRAQRRRTSEMWRSWRWWLAGVAVLLVLLPMVWDLARKTDSFGLLDSLKTVLLPWAAGLGFGIWIYFAIDTLPGADRIADPRTMNGAADAVRRDLSFIPIAVALLFVTVIVSDQEYAWLARLQKLSVGSGGVEFAPQPQTRANAQDYRRSGPDEFQQIGERRIDALVKFMPKLEEIIARDVGYFDEGKYPHDSVDADLKRQFLFAHFIIKPLGTHLSDIHQRRGYNDLGILVDRAFIDTIRSFILSQKAAQEPESRDAPLSRLGDAAEEGMQRLKAERARLTKDVYHRTVLLWEKVCQTEERLRILRRESIDSCSHDRDAAVELMYSWFVLGDGDKLANRWTDMCRDQVSLQAQPPYLYLVSLCKDKTLSLEKEGIVLGRDHPYGTLLAAMLLYADGEADAAVRDLGAWIKENISDIEPRAGGASVANAEKLYFKRFGVLRALSLSTLLSEGTGDAAKTYVAVEQSRKLAEIGKALLSRSEKGDSARLSWRTQRERFEKRDGIDPVWMLGICSNDLTKLFKLVMAGYLATLNNIAFDLSQHTEFAERANLMREMEDYANYLGKKVDVRCLYDDRKTGDQTQAAFLDTVATVELTVARSKRDRSEKKRHLCDAQQYAETATKLQENTLHNPIGRPSDFANEVSDKRTEDPTLDDWENQLDEHTDIENWAVYRGRLQEARRQLADEGHDCN
jgi:hypothetical protein